MSDKVVLEYKKTELVIDSSGKVKKKGRRTYKELAPVFWDALIEAGWTNDQDVSIALTPPEEDGKDVKKGISILIDQQGHVHHFGYVPSNTAFKWWELVRKARPK